MSEYCRDLCLHPEAVAKASARLGDAPLERVAESFRVLGDRTRVGILVALGAAELCVCDLAELFAVTPGAVSHQLRLLRAHKLVKSRRRGKMVFYSLDDSHVRSLVDLATEHARE